MNAAREMIQTEAPLLKVQRELTLQFVVEESRMLW